MSAIRLPHQRLQEILEDRQIGRSGDRSAYAQSVPFSEVDLSQVPQLPSQQALLTLFTTIRESRFLPWDSNPDFKRRIPWLYIEDGCFLRADRMAERFADWGYPMPVQAMIFGELSAETAYGHGYWWYHVAPIYRVGTDAFIIDPSVDLTRPLPLEAWILRMAPSTENIQISVCSRHTLMPEFDCFLSEAWWDPADRDAATQNFLDLEWAQIAFRSPRGPELLLGDAPPWRASRLTQLFNSPY